MKNQILLYLFISLCTLNNVLFAENTKITLATGDFAPYTGKDLPHFGVFNEIVTAAFKEINIDVEYKSLPWKRGEKAIKQLDKVEDWILSNHSDNEHIMNIVDGKQS